MSWWWSTFYNMIWPANLMQLYKIVVILKTTDKALPIYDSTEGSLKNKDCSWYHRNVVTKHCTPPLYHCTPTLHTMRVSVPHHPMLCWWLSFTPHTTRVTVLHPPHYAGDCILFPALSSSSPSSSTGLVHLMSVSGDLKRKISLAKRSSSSSSSALSRTR